ncbi:hypothetical protein ACFO0A_03525 [Novosphingobium tardum]|jgi:hypothetical protein|uniref:HIG1 domain-containing protein n=1 Tax=Novosphingobium tardum TaxID=1538021 RepID=A0ABV8RML1_9SPHN
MNTLLALVVVGFAIMAAISLVRGIIAFLQSTKEDLASGTEGGATPMQLKQNKMMFNRIKYQALAIIAVAVLMLFNR